MNNYEWFKLLIQLLLIAPCIILLIVVFEKCAHAQDLRNADFIADPQFSRWCQYACHKSPDRGLEAVTQIERAALKCGIEDYGKLVAVAWYESRFKQDAVSSGGHRGMLQIATCHKRKMKQMGLDFYSEADRLEFGCLLYKWHGLQPWSTRAKARRDYNKVLRDAKC